MYYLSNFSKVNQEPQPNFFKKTLNTGVSKVKNTVQNFPNFQTQTKDFLKVKAANAVKKQLEKEKLTLKQKAKLGKGYLKYRKHLGDTYGKKQGMSILQNQKQYIKNLVNPSYKQIPLD